VAEVMTGYNHPAYAGALSEFGAPRFLPASKAWILKAPNTSGKGRDKVAEHAFTRGSLLPLLREVRASRAN
jgi:hypothetical protein